MKSISLEAIKTYATRYRGRDGKERIVLFQDHYESMLAMIERRDKLVLHMINTFLRLGNDTLARIDARAWHEYYTRRARRMGIVKPARKK